MVLIPNRRDCFCDYLHCFIAAYLKIKSEKFGRLIIFRGDLFPARTDFYITKNVHTIPVQSSKTGYYMYILFYLDFFQKNRSKKQFFRVLQTGFLAYTQDHRCTTPCYFFFFTLYPKVPNSFPRLIYVPCEYAISPVSFKQNLPVSFRNSSLTCTDTTSAINIS